MAANEEDVIALLQRQHREIREMFTELETAAGDRRRDLFRGLVRLLAVHETAEEEVVHPEIRDLDASAASVVEARLGEEHRAKELLTTLQSMGPEADGFDTLLVQLREEFPLLRAHRPPERLQAMAATVRLAEAVAPTRPHPGVESAKANLLLGPPAAIMDRARDAIRGVFGH
jgi:hypothetical protein